ncbi:Calcium-transporting ATPase 1 [Durusdinium trenchii]|uniref:Endoplasmic reticulum-type n=1 Tax=Durusdinium trenchii TaxID=1381693 RepID=A0ABP0H8J0_9DINO
MYIAKLCKGRTCNDLKFPILDYDAATKTCVCTAHPCWNDNGLQHKCPGEKHDDKFLTFFYEKSGKLNCGCSKEPDYKSLYLSKELCPGEHCTPEHPILDYDQDLPGNAMDTKTCICRTHPCGDIDGLTHTCPTEKFPILRYRVDEESKNVCECIAPMHAPKDEL